MGIAGVGSRPPRVGPSNSLDFRCSPRYNEGVELDIPDEVRRKVFAEGNAAWLDGLPSVVESLVLDWSLTIGDTLRGGHAAFVVAVTLADGTAAVLKVGVPGTRRELGYEAAVLRLVDGDGCARLLCDDLDRDALLLERLGAAMCDVVPDPAARHDMLCDVAARLDTGTAGRVSSIHHRHRAAGRAQSRCPGNV